MIIPMANWGVIVALDVVFCIQVDCVHPWRAYPRCAGCLCVYHRSGLLMLVLHILVPMGIW